MTDTSAILDKARKLQALRDNAGTVHEAAAAAEKLQQLLIQHHIEEHQLDAQQASKVEVRAYDLGRDFVSANFRRDLMYTIVRSNGGRMVYTIGRNKAEIVAHVASIDVMIWTYEYIRSQYKQLFQVAYAEHKAELARWGQKAHAPSFGYAFGEGLLRAIQKRMRDMRQTIATAAESSALVVVMDAAVEEKYHERFPNLGKAQKRHVSTGAGYQQGFAAGSRIDIGGQRIGSGAAGRLKG